MCACLPCAPDGGPGLFTQACALTGNETGNPLVCRPALNPLSQPARAEVSPFAIAWVDMENIMLSEIKQLEEDKYHMISYVESNKQNKLMNRLENRGTDTQNRLTAVRG